MDKKQQTYLFHLFRKDGTPLFVHPFSSDEQVMNILENYEVIGLYGYEPKVESLTMFRNQLYRMVEQSVKNWVTEIKFIPRFLLSSLVFLVVYFFLSYIIRDPIPLLDEIAISLGGSLLTYFLLGKRDAKSDLSMKKRVKLRAAVDKIVFIESEFVKKMEMFLQNTETDNPEKLLEYITGPADQFLTEQERDYARDLIHSVEKLYNKNDLQKKVNIVTKLAKDQKEAKAQQMLTKWSSSSNVDVPILALYTRMKRSLQKI
ncbi:MAG: hypothetical protein ACLFR1_05725 [Spirochaetia bacterium]